jgi:hypothetical protein
MLDHRCNAFDEAMHGLMQQVKRAARGFRTAATCIACSCLRLGQAHSFAGIAVSARHNLFNGASPRIACDFKFDTAGGTV